LVCTTGDTFSETSIGDPEVVGRKTIMRGVGVIVGENTCGTTVDIVVCVALAALVIVGVWVDVQVGGRLVDVAIAVGFAFFTTTVTRTGGAVFPATSLAVTKTV
jgi:hypothetical protein